MRAKADGSSPRATISPLARALAPARARSQGSSPKEKDSGTGKGRGTGKELNQHLSRFLARTMSIDTIPRSWALAVLI
jgi:hypothetical protein